MDTSFQLDNIISYFSCPCIYTNIKDDLIESVKYYCEEGKINTKSTMANHLEAIKSFYEFIHKNGKSNNIFADIPVYSEFKDYISDMLSLSDTTERDYLQMNVVIEVLEHFDGIGFEKLSNDEQIICLFIKLTLIAPAKRGILSNIKIADFSDNFRCMTINEVKIKIPNSLRKEIIYCLSESEKRENSKYTDNTLFFEYIYIKAFSGNIFNTPLAKALIAVEYDIPITKNPSFSVEKVMNTAIVHMIRTNTNPALIAKINGVKITAIEKKVEKYGVEIENYSELINTSLMNAKYYQYI